MELYARIKQELEKRKEEGTFRQLPLVTVRNHSILFDTVSYVDLVSNDYLGIARDSSLLQTFYDTMCDTKDMSSFASDLLTNALTSGSTGSRLLSGNHYFYPYCEDLLASLFNGSSSLHSIMHEEQEDRCGIFANHHKVKGIELRDEAADFARSAALQAQVAANVAINQENKRSTKDNEVVEEQRKCLYFNSGFDANQGVLSTLFKEGDLLLVDKLSHASIIDGMMHSKAKSIRFAHNDMEHLAHLLELNHDKYDNILIVTEAVFSMDGDMAPLQRIVQLKHKYKNVMIYVDEAHSFGLFGENGLGLCEELGVIADVDFIMGTLSKAIGSVGAFLICRNEVKEYLVNFMRPLIYSTALPPVNVAFSLYVIGLLNTVALQSKRDYLKKISSYLHLCLMELDLNPSQSQIQPLLTGDNDKAVLASKLFRRAGLLALPIRHPTVPKGKARLRLSLNCNVRLDDIDLICSLVRHYRHLFINN